MRKHVAAFGGLWMYENWCEKNGFRTGLDKTLAEISNEQASLNAELKRLDANAKLHRNPKKLIENICMGRITSADIDRPVWREFSKIIEKSRGDIESRTSLLSLLQKVHSTTDFLLEEAEFSGRRYPYIAALIKLNDRRGQWLQTYDNWRPTTHNAAKQFSSLVRHLVAGYPVPLFMDQAWFRIGKSANVYRNWFVHLGAGKNIRTADLPVPMTKLMAHHMMLAPNNYSIEDAIRWGQIHALGGNRNLTEAVMGTRIGETFANNEFWLLVFKFFIANPMLDRVHVGPIIDFLNHQKFETQEVLGHDGQTYLEPPPQPNLSMRGRTVETILAQVEQWHVRLGRAHYSAVTAFPPSGFKELALEAGRDGKNLWTIKELLSGSQLRAESKAMRHCVASYERSCATGNCSIWALELRTSFGVEKRQTVEVSKRGEIVQSRGKFNRLPTFSEFEILKTWASYAGLRIAPYVSCEN